MVPTDSLPKETFWQEDSFRFIKPDEFEALGIDPSDIPVGTFAALKHPSHLESRFGGNAYGSGLFEVYDRLRPKDIKFLQNITFEDPEAIRNHYKTINEIYKKIGLLIRYSRHGHPYYLIPVHLVSNTLAHIKAKVEEISKIIAFHRKKYLKEQHVIGLVTHTDDLLIHELTFRFKEHRFMVLDSLESLQSFRQTLDLVILTWAPYEIVLMDKFSTLAQEMPSKRRLDQYAMYILWKLYNLLKPDGELFIVANRYTRKTSQSTRILFKTAQEEKSFLLFTHLFRTKKKYRIKNHSLHVNVFDFQKYLDGLYVEQEVMDKLLQGKALEDVSVEEIDHLPYINLQLADLPFLGDQEKTWSKLLPVYFDTMFLKPLVPESIKEEWKKRFTCREYDPSYMLIYLGQKKPLKTTLTDLKRDVTDSKLIGCPPDLLAEYRDSFEFVIQTLRVLEDLKAGHYGGLPRVFMERLKQPLENKSRRFSNLNDVMKLVKKVGRIERTKTYFNPDNIEGTRTQILKNLEALAFFDFSYNERKEILYIVLGHTPLGRVISGKLNEKALKPVSDLARTFDPQQGLNLLRYSRLLTWAETEATRGSQVTQEQLAELFNLYESTVRVVLNRDLDWDRLLDEKITGMGGIHNKIIRKLLKMMNHFEFLENWPELREKGAMEKEALADYDDHKLSRIENVIRLVNIIEKFEERYLRQDPLRLPAFYRRFMDMEFHGTGHLFERMDSRNVFILLWIMVNLARGESINFNPILAGSETQQVDDWVRKVEEEVRNINLDYLELNVLRQFSDQLHQIGSSFIIGTGFQLKIDSTMQALEITCMDMNKDIERLDNMAKRLAGTLISEIPAEELKDLETLFSNLESFYQSHLRLLGQEKAGLKLPARQKQWYLEIQALRERLKTNFLNVIFQPEDVYTDLDLLYHHAPSLLNFILPEFTALEDLDFSSNLYLKSPVTHYIITATKKLQALVRHDRASFQDTQFLHRLAKREFGPMAAGIVGVSEQQLEALEKCVENLSRNQPLFDALIKAFIFQDLGRVPVLREKYKDEVHPADLAHAGALFIIKEKIAERYYLHTKGKGHLIFLVRHHGFLHHIIRGELSFSAIKEILDMSDRDLFDAFFLFSFIMISALREDLILEDLANRLFQIWDLGHRILRGETALEEQLSEIYEHRGNLYFSVETYKNLGLPEGVSPADYLESLGWRDVEKTRRIRSGEMIFALERLFRLEGIRYAVFLDLANLIVKVPLKFIYKRRKFSSIGYATFEKELYEAFRIYNTLQNLAEETRHFILNQLQDDRVRIYGYEKVSGYLSYENKIKLLLAALLGTTRLESPSGPVCINFLDMSKEIEKRYEAVNDYLSTLSIEELWNDEDRLDHLFKAEAGVVLKKEAFPDVISVDFHDRINIVHKLSYMEKINDVEQLKNYFHYSLRSLREHPFYTDDYELELEKAFENRLIEITDMILNQTKRQMDLIEDFEELHNLVSDLIDRSLEIGFSEDQKNRLSDLYELRKTASRGKNSPKSPVSFKPFTTGAS